MKRYSADILSDITGLSLIGAALDVYVAGTETRVTLYKADDTDGDTVGQPVPNGTAFYIPDGRYDLRARNGSKTRLIPSVDMFDGFEQNRRLEAIENGEPSAPGSLRADLTGPTGAELVNWRGRQADAKLADIVSVKDAQFAGGAKGDGVTDDTAAIQAAINATRQGGGLLFPPGRYCVTTLDMMQFEASVTFDEATLLAAATTPTTALIRFGGLHSCIHDMKINGQFKTNYSCMLWWYNPDASSQHNSFHNLEIRYTNRAIIYGALPGTKSTLFAQSENHILGYRTRGVVRPFYNNHDNGFVFVIAPQFVSHDEEWQAGTFDYAGARTFENYGGNLIIVSGEIQSSQSPLGYAADFFGGRTTINSVVTEVAKPFRIGGTAVVAFYASVILNTQSITSQFTIDPGVQSAARLELLGTDIKRNPGTGGFSDRPMIDGKNAPPIEVLIDSCKIYDWSAAAPLISGSNAKIVVSNTRYLGNGALPPGPFYRLDSTSNDLLDRPALDRKGYTSDGWYQHNAYGGGTVFTLNADAPTGFAQSLDFTATGEAGWFTVGPFPGTDGKPLLADLKATAFRVAKGDSFLLEAWIRKVATSGDDADGGLSLLLFDAAGEFLPDRFASTATIRTGFVDDGWKFVRQVVQVTSTAAAFAGFGVWGKRAQIRMAGLEVRRANWIK